MVESCWVAGAVAGGRSEGDVTKTAALLQLYCRAQPGLTTKTRKSA